jgi:hypothetical protein
MICPRCGTVAAGQTATCGRCGGSLERAVRTGVVADPPVPRAPTRRGELAQREAGIVPQILARPKPPAPSNPPPTAGPPAPYEPVAPPSPTPGPGVQSWPPPPAVWEPGTAAGPGHSPTPTHAPPPHAPASQHSPRPAPGWAGPGPGWSRGAAPDFARSAAGWARAVTGRGRLATSPSRSAAPASYLWQSLACLLLFLPSALVAVVYSTRVNRRVQVGDMTGAARASRLARTWCLVSVVVFTGLVLWMIAGGSVP